MKQRGFLIAVLVAGIGFTGLVRHSAAAEKSALIAATEEISRAYRRIENLRVTLIQRQFEEGRQVTITEAIQFAHPYYYRSVLEIREQGGSKTGGSLTVFDGNVLWTETHNPDGSVLNVTRATIDPETIAGGRYLRQFVPATAFEALREQYQLRDLRPLGNVTVLELVMDEETRQEMEETATMLEEDISESLPVQVRFYWDTEQQFCQKVETLNASQEIISSLEYQDSVINGGMDAEVFAYTPPADVTPTDVTYLIMQQQQEADF